MLLAMTRVFEKQRVVFKSALERRSKMGATVVALVFQIKPKEKRVIAEETSNNTAKAKA